MTDLKDLNLPANIVENIDSFGNRVYPLSHMKGIIDDEGRTLDNILSDSDGTILGKIEELFFGAYEELDTLKEIGDAIKAGNDVEVVLTTKITEIESNIRDLQTALTNYIQTVDADNKYALKTAIQNWITQEQADNLYVKLTDINEINNTLSDKQDKATALKVWTGTQAEYDAMKDAGTLPPYTIFGIDK